ncbi:MAG: MurR/RpiR family transcriptional regulator [Paracoccaceae bacterium]|nr:MurR/RpiR family transcriptional regulator [Paracoccaceae bacterium]
MTELRLKDLTPHSLQALSPQLRRAAQYVVENPGEVATRSQRSIARTTNLPAPTFTRMARAVGYESYDALRETCRAEVLGSRTHLAEMAQELIEADDESSGIATRHAAAAIRNTEALFAGIDPGELDKAVETLARARHVALIGEMSAQPIVEYAHYLANMSLNGWIVPGRGGTGMANDLADLGSDDACVLFSIKPYAARAIAIAGIVRAQNVRLIAVTDSPLSPVTAYARQCFFIRTDSQHFFPSHVAAIVFFEAVVGMAARKRGKESQERIAAIERQNHQLERYWQDRPATNEGG